MSDARNRENIESVFNNIESSSFFFLLIFSKNICKLNHQSTKLIFEKTLFSQHFFVVVVNNATADFIFHKKKPYETVHAVSVYLKCYYEFNTFYGPLQNSVPNFLVVSNNLTFFQDFLLNNYFTGAQNRGRARQKSFPNNPRPALNRRKV